MSKINVLDVLREQKEMNLKGNLYHNTQIIFAYNTNHIEGSKLTEDQTRYIYETNTILDRRDMSDSYYWLGVILEKQDMKKALDYYEDSCKISNELLEEALRTDWVAVKRDLARAYMRIGALMEKAKKYDDKRTYFYKAARLYRDDGFLTHEEQDYVKVAICYFQAAMVIEAVDEIEDNRPILKVNVNKELLQKSYEAWSKLTNWYPNNRKYKEEKDKVQK